MAEERVICICNTQFYLDKSNKFIDKNLLPLAPCNTPIPEFKKDDESYIDFEWLQFRDFDTKKQILFDKSEYKLTEWKDFLCLKIDDEISNHIKNHSKDSDNIYICCEGDMSIYKVVIFFSKIVDGDDEVIRETKKHRSNHYKNPIFKEMNFENLGIPPNECIVIPEGHDDSGNIEDYFHCGLINFDPELADKLHKRYLIGTLKGEGTLRDSTALHLFDLMNRVPSDNVAKYFKAMDKFSQYLSINLENKKSIVQLEKNHKENNAFWKNKLISFIDGGMSTIKGMPLENPQLVRVGDYNVKPGATLDGENPAPDREIFSEKTYIVHDIFNDESIIKDDEYENFLTDTQKRNEAARYIFEAHYAWMRSKGYRWNSSSTSWEFIEVPEVIFFHGPLQNKFELYTTNAPHHIPGISKDWLKENHISEEDIKESFGSSFNEEMNWNAPLVIYTFLMREFKKSKIPILGCVERSNSATMAKMYFHKYFPDNEDRKKLDHNMRKYKLVDDKLWGYVLDEGQFINPIEMSYKTKYGELTSDKNNKYRLADPIYGPIIDKMPKVYGTMLNCAFKKLPFRIEINRLDFKYSIENLINLVYHTSLLLPKYLFPVGLDVIDKHVKVPASLSGQVDKGYLVKAYSIALKADNDNAKKTGKNSRKNMHHAMSVLSANKGRNFFSRPSEQKLTNRKRDK